uniref:Uncharacterized protein n=1 Tax=Acrobeloides nanus TaxID=290746 RepID=A0A914ELC7_9BILA
MFDIPPLEMSISKVIISPKAPLYSLKFLSCYITTRYFLITKNSIPLVSWTKMANGSELMNSFHFQLENANVWAKIKPVVGNPPGDPNKRKLGATTKPEPYVCHIEKRY